MAVIQYSKIYMAVFFILFLFSDGLYSQDRLYSSAVNNGRENHPKLYKVKLLSSGIHAIENYTSTEEYETIDQQKSTRKVNKNFDRKDTPNPFNFSISFEVRLAQEGYYHEIKSLMNPLSFKISDNITITYTGDEVFFPVKMEVGDKLKEAKGVYSFSLENTGLLSQIDVMISDREVVGVEDVTINNQSVTCYLISYTIKEARKFKNNPEQVFMKNYIDWYIPGYGFCQKVDIKDEELKQKNSMTSLKQKEMQVKLIDL